MEGYKHRIMDSLLATGEHAYRRPEDGIYVVPIGCLKQ